MQGGIIGANTKPSGMDSSGFVSGGDTGFILGLHRPGRPGLVQTKTIVAVPRSLPSRQTTASTEFDSSPPTVDLKSLTTDSLSSVTNTQPSTTLTGSLSSSEPSGSLMPPIGGRRKVGVLGVGPKRSVVGGVNTDNPAVTVTGLQSPVLQQNGTSSSVITTGSPVVAAAGRSLIGTWRLLIVQLPTRG